ncbi:MAG: aldehyde dehydrogenase family protein [Streptosporangiaceae bacterium]|jgi:2-formylbenzoate dehydrogenase
MTNMLIGGELVPAAGGRTYDDVSPVTGEVIAQVPDASDADVASAVDAAAAAAKAWRRLPAGERGALVGRLADILAEHGDELAQLDSVDGGHPLVSMLQDVDIALEGMRLFAGLGGEIKGETIPASGEHLHYTVREPFGVVAKIIPFNHPLMFAAAKIAAPLVAGNTVVLKPPETAPLSALRMGELFASELPPGVLNIVVGDGPGTGRALVRHPLVRRIGFTGSEATGRAVQRDAAEVGVKDVTLELGGKNAMIAFPDASPSEVAGSVVRGMNFVRSAGQSCGSTSRLLLHSSIADAVLDEVVALMAAIKVGDPRDPGTEMGTLATPGQYEKALRYIEIAKSEGARLRTGGGRPAGLEDDPGLYLAPTLFDNVRPDMRIAQEEVFGPVLSAITWSTEEEAIDIANSVDYGLTASVWTNDVRRAHRVVRELEAGFVWINGSSAHFTGVPFGGFKLSGLGREENLDELLSYTQIKAVNVMM